MTNYRTFNDLLDGQDGDTAETVAAGIVADLKLSAAQRHALWPIVVNEVRRSWRNDVRPLEPSRLATRRRNDDFEGEATDPAASRTSYLSKRFAVCAGGKYVTWGEATVEDHRSRVEFLRGLVRGTERTINDHLGAIHDIETTPGATCLADIRAAA